MDGPVTGVTSIDRVTTAALADLIAALPDGTVVTDPDILGSYRQDRAADPSAGTPLAVVRPARTQEVQAVMRWATTHRIAVVRVARAPDSRAARPRSTVASCSRPSGCATSPWIP